MSADTLSRRTFEPADLTEPLDTPESRRILLALSDGRALTASMLADEAGMAPQTARAHVHRLLDAGLLAVRAQRRHRYYALAGPCASELAGALARETRVAPVRSLREGSRSYDMRRARTCYDHLAGRLGVALFAALLQRGLLTGGDGRHVHPRARLDRLSAVGRDRHYRLTADGLRRLTELGVELPGPDEAGEVRAGYCVDWTEQAHHLSGAVGRALTERLFDLVWLDRVPGTRAVRLSSVGARGMRDTFAVSLPDP